MIKLLKVWQRRGQNNAPRFYIMASSKLILSSFQTVANVGITVIYSKYGQLVKADRNFQKFSNEEARIIVPALVLVS